MLISRMTLCSLFVALGQPALAQDVHILSGQTVEYDTDRGDVTIDSLVIDADATLRIVGSDRFKLVARRGILVNGTLDVSGADAWDVVSLNTAIYPEWGAAGGPGGGAGRYRQP